MPPPDHAVASSRAQRPQPGHRQHAGGPEDDDLPAWAHHSQVDPQLSPVLRHYVELKAAHPERVLLYRLGDFFECFFGCDQLSRLLELTLTGKEGGEAIGRVPMAGIPHHAAERYCAELIRRGCCVACVSWKPPGQGGAAEARHHPCAHPRHGSGGGAAQRAPRQLAGGRGVEAATADAIPLGLVSADVSTGEVQLMQRQGSDNLHQELSRLDPSELLW